MPDPLRLLHLADVHLGTPFAGRSPELRERLRSALQKAFEAAMAEALARGVQAVTIAGDLYEAATLSYADERWLVRQLARLGEAGIAVFYATGNHDPAGPRQREMAWPPGVEVFAAREPRTVPLQRHGQTILRVAGAGHETSAETLDLAASFPAATPGPPVVGVLHAQVGGTGGGRHERYAPTEIATLEASGYACWALGHVHLRQALPTAGLAIYPGNLQGRDPTETGPRGAALIEIDAGGLASYRWLDLAPLLWLTLEVRLDSRVRDPDEALQAVREAVEGSLDHSSRERALVRAVLTGRAPAATRLSDDQLLSQLAREGAAESGLADLELVTADLRAPVEVDSRRGRPDVLGLALDLTAAARLERGDDLLEGAEEELVERFQRS